VGGLVYLMATADTGPVDPTEVRQSHGTAVFNASIIVFREGLEAVLIFAAVTASFIGGNRARRRPVVLGAACAFAASFVIGSYYLAEYLMVTRPVKRGARPAVRSTAPPEAVA
jgi:high-affinity iron transporter